MAPFIAFDDGKGLLSPLTDLRPAFDLRTGALTTLERFQACLRGFAIGLFVPPVLADLTRERHVAPVNSAPLHPALLVNARCPIPPDRAASLALGEAIREAATGDLIAAHVSPRDAAALLDGSPVDLKTVSELPAPALLARPWHVRVWRDRCLAYDLDFLGSDPGREPPDTVYRFGQHRLRVALSATVHPTVTLDLESGPIGIDEHAVIRPGAILIGPCYVGQHSTVLERATIRQHTSIGPWCKVNGEVGGTIFQGFSNKAHDGYVGDSYIGEWVNLGAGTTTSNLLNTYGEVIARASPGSGHERTGQQFLGPVFGDHVKTAICTRLMTGSIIHTGAMIASTAAASGCIPPFAWITDAGTRSYRLDKFSEVMTAAMARRKITPSDAYRRRIAALHALAS